MLPRSHILNVAPSVLRSHPAVSHSAYFLGWTMQSCARAHLAPFRAPGSHAELKAGTRTWEIFSILCFKNMAFFVFLCVYIWVYDIYYIYPYIFTYIYIYIHISYIHGKFKTRSRR